MKSILRPSSIFILFFSLFLFFSNESNAVSSFGLPDLAVDSDTPDRMLFGFFDLRDRESFIQVTNLDTSNTVLHIQIFNVDDNCNENNFFDVYTPNDTHVYNISDIQTNDGNPSGVILPNGAYGAIVVSSVQGVGQNFLTGSNIFGNQRILDAAGYEYRTNMVARISGGDVLLPFGDLDISINFNTEGGISFSDIVGFAVSGNSADPGDGGEVTINPLNDYWLADIDIYNLDEVPFSCRNVIFSCVDQDNPLLEELLENASSADDSPGASVASFEYGINNAIPHSKGGELLCPGNNISEGVVSISSPCFQCALTEDRDDLTGRFIIYVGLNSGNGRGSMDSYWFRNAPEVGLER